MHLNYRTGVRGEPELGMPVAGSQRPHASGRKREICGPVPSARREVEGMCRRGVRNRAGSALRDP